MLNAFGHAKRQTSITRSVVDGIGEEENCTWYRRKQLDFFRVLINTRKIGCWSIRGRRVLGELTCISLREWSTLGDDEGGGNQGAGLIAPLRPGMTIGSGNLDKGASLYHMHVYGRTVGSKAWKCFLIRKADIRSMTKVFRTLFELSILIGWLRPCQLSYKF